MNKAKKLKFPLKDNIKFRGKVVGKADWIIGSPTYINEEEGIGGIVANDGVLYTLDSHSLRQYVRNIF